MAIYLLRHPLNVLMAGEEAIRRLVPPGEEAPQIHLRINGLPRDRRVQIRDLRAKHLGQYISVEGLVRKSREVRPKVVGALFQCLRCGTVIKEEQDGQTFREPLECYEEQGGCKRSANATKFKLLTETSLYLDTQKIEVQEAPEGLRGGEEPQRLTAYVEDDLTGRITPGQRVILNGVLRSVQRGRPGQRSTLFDIFVDVNSVEMERVEFEEIEVTEDDARGIREIGSSRDICRMITASIAPSLYGMQVEKEALALQLFSGVAKVMPDGRRIRGDIHLILVGDPGTGKSELLSYMSRLSPRGIYATGKAASAAGLCVAADSLIATDRGIRSIEEITVPCFRGAERVRPMETAARLMLSEDSLYHAWRSGHHGIPLAPLLGAARAAGLSEETVAESIRSYSQAGGHRIDLPVRLNENLAYFAGLIAGDGSVERGKLNGFSIRFNNSNPILISVYTDLARQLFGANLDFTPQTTQRAATVRFHSRLVAAILSELGVPPSPKSHRLDLPAVLFNGPVPNLGAYLRGLFDTDGTIQARATGSHCLSLTTSSQALANRVQTALLRFGVHAIVRVRRRAWGP